MTKKETGYMPVGEIVNATKKAFEAFTVLEVGKSILKEIKKCPSSKCLNCGHTIMLIDKKYNKYCKPYLLHNWKHKCHCNCVKPKMDSKELKDLIKFSNNERKKRVTFYNRYGERRSFLIRKKRVKEEVFEK